MNLLQCISDLHLEKNDIYEQDFVNILKPVSEIVILGGDIGNPFTEIYEKFVCYCSKNFTVVLIIAGNHEYYGNTIQETDEKMNNLCVGNGIGNVHYLNNKTFNYNEITFIGTTLWSDIPQESHMDCLTLLKDYTMIQNFSLEKQKSMYQTNLDFIQTSLSTNHNCIIISHHAPTYLSIPSEFVGDKLNCCFASHLDHLLVHENLIGWIYGHTHHNYIHYTEHRFIYSNCYRTADYKNAQPIL
jgi:hypothetical protein